MNGKEHQKRRNHCIKRKERGANRHFFSRETVRAGSCRAQNKMTKISYFVLYTCDEWKSYSSMSMIGVFSRRKLIPKIKEKAREGVFVLEGAPKELNHANAQDINNLLTYGYIEEIHLNEDYS